MVEAGLIVIRAREQALTPGGARNPRTMRDYLTHARYGD
jgi:hypothetical protein